MLLHWESNALKPRSGRPGPSGSPWRLQPRLDRAEGHTLRAEGCCARSARRVREGVPTFGAEPKIREARGLDDRLQLCLQQSAGNSPCPEVDVLLRLPRHLLLNDDVGDLE